MTKQTRFRTFQIKRNDNLSVPIGNFVYAQAFFERFGFDEVIRALKTKGIDLVKLAEEMVSYKAGDNFSILFCHEFVMYLISSRRQYSRNRRNITQCCILDFNESSRNDAFSE